MKFAAADLRKIQASLLAVVLAGIVSLTAVLVAFEQRQAAQKSRTAASEAQRERNGKLAQLGQDGGAKLALFGELRQRGVIGEEQRLDWIELLNALRRKHGIALQYELAPQRELEPKAAGAFSIYASSMKLQLGLLHEEDLLRVLDELRQQARALLLLRHCKLSRRHEIDDEPDRRPGTQLQADCLIDWVTLRERSGQ